MPNTLLNKKQNEMHPIIEAFGVGFHVKSMGERAELMNVSLPTARRFQEDPDQMTIGHYKRLCKRLGVPEEDMQKAIRYR